LKTVSVMIRAHGEAPWLIDALDSVVLQDYTGEIRILVSLDSPSENLIEKLNRWPHYDQLRVLYVDNLGLSAPLNLMLDSTNAEYVCVLDSDDVMLPERVSNQVKFLNNNPGVAVVGSWINYINGLGKITGVKKYSDSIDYIRANQFKQLPVAHPAVMMRRNAVIEVGGYRSFYDFAEDFDLWCRILEKYNISNIDTTLSSYRLHDAQATKKYNQKNVVAAEAVLRAASARREGKLEPHLEFKDIDEFSKRWEVRIKILRRKFVFESTKRSKNALLKRKIPTFIFYILIIALLNPLFLLRKFMWSSGVKHLKLVTYRYFK